MENAKMLVFHGSNKVIPEIIKVKEEIDARC
jgi:hypothetical protein